MDSTGINLWPAEEFLAYYIIQNIDDFKNTNLCELVAGYSGLASLAYAIKMINNNIKILITDGNEVCSDSIFENIKLNDKLK